MASQGPLFPTATATFSTGSESANDWVSPGNVGADDGTESTITAATYDSPDISFRLFAGNFGFTIPGGATIDGIVVEIDRRSIIANSGKDFRVELGFYTTGNLAGGDNKAAPATIWPSSSAIATYGSPTDTWNTPGLDVSITNNSTFAICLSAQANIANADIGVDFMRMTIYYTPAAATSIPFKRKDGLFIPAI